MLAMVSSLADVWLQSFTTVIALIYVSVNGVYVFFQADVLVISDSFHEYIAACALKAVL